MSDFVALEELSAAELHDLAVRRARRHLDVRFFFRLAKFLPLAEAGTGDLWKAEGDLERMSAHLDDITDSGRGEVAEFLRPFYLEYLQQHHVQGR
jgi:hypothetical protein